jgi:hypothetical protein
MTIFDDMAEKREAASPSCQKVKSGCCGVPVYQLSPIQFTYNGSMSEANADYLAACINDISTAQWRAMGHMQHILEAIAHIDNTHGGGPYEALHYVRLWAQESLSRLKEGE